MTPLGPELTLNDGHGRQTSTPRLRRIGIDTYQEAVIYMRRDCHIYRAEGFEAQSRVQIAHGDHFIIATLNVVEWRRCNERSSYGRQGEDLPEIRDWTWPY